MSNIIPFSYNSKQVRTIIKDGEPWFVAKDVCGILEISNGRDAISRLDTDEKDAVGITDTIGRIQLTTIISESGVYALVFTSRKPEAELQTLDKKRGRTLYPQTRYLYDT